jgi:hypothetical protein
MISLIQYYWTSLQSNPAVFSVLITILLGGLTWFCRGFLLTLKNFIIGLVCVHVDVIQLQDFYAYNCLEYELATKKLYCIFPRFQMIYQYFIKNIRLTCTENTLYLAKLGKFWVLVRKARDTKESLYHTYIYELSFLTRDKEAVNKYLQSLQGNYQKASSPDKIRVFKYIENNWEYLEKPKIKFENDLPEYKQKIIESMKYFINNENEYAKKALLRHMGILLHGLPGCGKSYFIIQLASYFDINIYYMNPADFKNNNGFVKAVMEIDFPAIMLIEDLDCIKSSHDREEEQESKQNSKELITGVGLETLLNVFDGLLSQDNQIVIATTNHLDKLDEALTRAGRFHLKVEFGLLTRDEIYKYLVTYYDVKDIPLHNFKPISIAELVAICTANNLNETLKLLPIK